MESDRVSGSRLHDIWKELKRQRGQIAELRVESQALRRCLEASGTLKAVDYEDARGKVLYASAKKLQPREDVNIKFSRILERGKTAASLRLALFLSVQDLHCFAVAATCCRAVVSALHSRIYAVGGANVTRAVGSHSMRQLHTTVERLDCRTGVWTPVAPMLQARNRAGAACTRGKLYLVGGLMGNQALASVDCFDMLKEEWESGLTPMSAARAACAAVACNGDLYVLGGSSDGRQFLESVELFDVSGKKWSQLPPWKNVRAQCSVVAVRNQVYAIGGLSGKSVSRSTDCFDISSKVWASASSMSTARFDFTAAVVGTSIYAIGGFGEDSTILDTVERLRPELGSWDDLPAMLHPAGACTAVAKRGKVYVLGGSDGIRTYKLMQCYSVAEKCWRNGPSMQERRMAAFAATMLEPEAAGERRRPPPGLQRNTSAAPLRPTAGPSQPSPEHQGAAAAASAAASLAATTPSQSGATARQKEGAQASSETFGTSALTDPSI